MHIRTLRHSSRRMRSSVLALCAALCLTVVLSTAAFANNVEIYDNARVLNTSQVQSDASNLSDPIRIYTFPSYSGTVSQFNNQAALSENTTKTIVIAINTGARYVYITGGKDAGLNSSDYNNAVTAFKNSFNGNYTNATIAAIDSLKSKLGSGFSINPVLGVLCCVGLLVLVVFGVFGALRRRGRGNVAPVYNAPVGYGPQNYGAPQQGGGMNPWVAGGLGAAGGGFLGYELGKAEGEREARREMQGGYREQGGFGGGAGGFFGGEQGGFGGGAGGNFGGDQGGGFGGGGNFGGNQSGGNEGFGGFSGGGGNEGFGGFSGGDSNNNDGGGSSF